MDTMFEFRDSGRAIRVFYDCEYQTRGSYAYDTTDGFVVHIEETRQAEDEELSKLESGEWVVVGFIAYDGCDSCGNLSEFDSCWGIVVENDEERIKELVLDMVGS